MKAFLVLVVVILAVGAGSACRNAPDRADDAGASIAARGSIGGRVRLSGPVPDNAPIRMRADPMCDRVNNGQRVLDEVFSVGADNGLANAFVQLLGDFPDTAAPEAPVTIDQRGCVYRPRVVGLRQGQPLAIRNSDPGLHNVHGVSKSKYEFNVGQPVAGLTNVFRPKEPGILELKCDVHTWMVAFVGVVSHPFFAVTDASGGFEMHDVPVGTYDIQAWHETLGSTTANVRVEANRAVEVEIVMVSHGDQPPVR